MKSITINIQNDKVARKIVRYLKSLKNEGIEIVSEEDMEDLKLLRATRKEDSISFEDYLDKEI